MKTLVEAGHEVHVASPFPLKSPIENYHDIFLDYGNIGKFINFAMGLFINFRGGEYPTPLDKTLTYKDSLLFKTL